MCMICAFTGCIGDVFKLNKYMFCFMTKSLFCIISTLKKMIVWVVGCLWLWTTELHVLVNRGRVYDHCIFILVYTFSVSNNVVLCQSTSTCASEALHPCRIFDMLSAIGLGPLAFMCIWNEFHHLTRSITHSILSVPSGAWGVYKGLSCTILYHNYIGATIIDVLSYMRWGSNSQHCFWKPTENSLD